jgi:hypothetical protein
LRLVTEGYNGQIVTSDNSWPKIYAAFQSKTILQVEAKGVRNYTVDGERDSLYPSPL